MDKTRAYIAPDILLRILINKSDCVAAVNVINNEDVEIVTSMFALYEALACVDGVQELDLDALIMLITKCAFIPQEDYDQSFESIYKMPEERKSKLREIALAKSEEVGHK